MGFHQARRCALSLALPHCSILSHDVLQIASVQSLVPPSGVRYISLICCSSCNYLGAKIISKNDSQEIASHLLDFISESGRIPALFLSDTGNGKKSEWKKVLNGKKSEWKKV